MSVKLDPNAFAEAAKMAGESGGTPPVHTWNPPFCGDMDMVITKDGTWVHEGAPINRVRLVRLFSTILRKDADGYMLVTPAERVRITVEDVPFIAIDLEPQGDGASQALSFTTNLGDAVTAGPAHPIELRDGVAYVLVRDDLWARLDRKSFYRLSELGDIATLDGSDWFGVHSGGVFFPLMPSDQLD